MWLHFSIPFYIATSCSLAVLFINESPDLYKMYRGPVSMRSGNGTQVEVLW